MLRRALAIRCIMSRSSILPALMASAVVIALGAAAMASVVWYLLPREGKTAEGLRIDGAEVPVGMSPADHVRVRAALLSNRPVTFRLGKATPEALALSDLGVRVDVETTLRRSMAVGRQGGLFYRIASCWRSRSGMVNVPLAWRIEPEPAFGRVLAVKDELDRFGTPARYDFANKSVRPHEDGQYLDVFATLDGLDRLIRAGGQELEGTVTSVPPLATASFLEKLDISQRVGHFETRFGYLGGQANRAHNIATAASRLDGVVILPQQIVSFNKVVGHRTEDNGFRKGWEIFKGEMVEGVGGGTCQVASTLYAAAYLAGLDIIERSPHSRPSGYIAMGLDATVVDGLVDLKLRNPFDFPVVLHSSVDKGQITFELLGEQRPVRVTFRGDVVSIQKYKRKVREAHWLSEGKVIRKQRGIRGYTVRRTRTMRSDGRTWEEVTTDIYPPTLEIFLVPPGTDPDEDLPPLPFEIASAAEEPVNEAACDGDCARSRPEIQDGPAARSSPPDPSHRVVIDR